MPGRFSSSSEGAAAAHVAHIAGVVVSALRKTRETGPHSKDGGTHQPQKGLSMLANAGHAVHAGRPFALRNGGLSGPHCHCE